MPSLRTVFTTAGAGALAVIFALGPSVLEIAIAADRATNLTVRAARLADAVRPSTPAEPTTETAVPGRRPVAATPAPAPSPTRSRTERNAPSTVPTTEAGRPIVYLTFDDGPDPAWTPRVLGILAEHKAEATFFVIGQKAATDGAIVRRTRQAGHAIGNHTYTHPWLTKLPTAGAREELVRTDATLGRTTCMRPPGGFVDGRIAEVAASLGKSVVLWGVDTSDWRRPGVGPIVTKVLADARPGAVILMHDGGGDRSQTVAALERILPALAARGYVMRSLPSCR